MMPRFRLLLDAKGVSLADSFSRQRPLRIAFDAPSFQRRLRQARGQSELLAKAVKPQPGLKVLDCTAGIGQDAFLLAHLGCQLTLCERSATVHALLEDGLRRALGHPALAEAAARITLLRQDALALLAKGACHDVIYLDPMFPQRKKQARVNGDMQHLQNFLGADKDATQLLAAALSQQAKRVVLKRPAHSDWSTPIKPNHLLESKTTRFEVFIP